MSHISFFTVVAYLIGTLILIVEILLQTHEFQLLGYMAWYAGLLLILYCNYKSDNYVGNYYIYDWEKNNWVLRRMIEKSYLERNMTTYTHVDFGEFVFQSKPLNRR